MTKKILSMLLAVLMVVSMIPMAAMAAEGDAVALGSATEITATGQVVPTEATAESPATVKVTVDPDKPLKWYKADEDVGRTADGWWIGINIIAPNEGDVSDVTFYRAGEGGTAWRNWSGVTDGQIDGKTYMQAWGRVTPEILKAAETTGNVEYTWYFNWDGNADTGKTVTTKNSAATDVELKGVDQIFTISFDPKEVTLGGAADGQTGFPEKGPVWPEVKYNGKSYSVDGFLALKQNGTLTLEDDVVLAKGIVVSNDLTVDLNGHKITASKDIYDSSTSPEILSLITQTGSEKTLTIKNEKATGGLIAREGDSYAADVRGGGNLVIDCTNTTEFIGNITAIYVSNTGGHVTINGGKYNILQHDDADIAVGHGHAFTLNCKDSATYGGSSTITVKKGIIVGVDPRDTHSDPQTPTNYVASTSTVKVLTEGFSCSKCGKNVEVYEVVEANGLVSAPAVVENGVATTTVNGTFAGSSSSTGSEENNETKETNTSVIINATTETEAKATEVTIPAETAATLGEQETTPELTVKTNVADVVLTPEAVDKIAEATEDVKIEVTEGEAGGNVKAKYTVTVTAGETEILSKGELGTDEIGEIQIIVDAPTGIAETEELQVLYVPKSGPVEPLYSKPGTNGKLIIYIGHLSTIELRAVSKTAVAMTEDGTPIEPADFVTEVAKGGVITLLKNVELESAISINGKEVTINGGGYAITAKEGITTTTTKGYMILSADTKLTLADVTIDANEHCGAIFSQGGSGELKITDGAKVTKGKLVDDYVAGVYVKNGKFTMDGGDISGNAVTGTHEKDGYLQYANDLWIGSQATAEISGGKVGTVFANANNAGGGSGANLTVKGNAVITDLFAESSSGAMGHAAVIEGGKVENLYMPLDDSDCPADTLNNPERTLVVIRNPKAGTETTRFTVPAGNTAEVVPYKNADGEIVDSTLTNSITIPATATLIIPEGVTVVTSGSGNTITVNGTLDVKGALIAGAGTSDTDYITIDGTGEVLGENIDLDKGEDGTAKAVTVTFLSDEGVVDSITINIFRDSASDPWPTKNITPPAAPARKGYTFGWWQNGSKKVFADGIVTIPATAKDGQIIRYMANWTKNPFIDVNEGDWFFDAVQYAYENGLVSGVSADEFKPYSNLTRAQFAQILYAMSDKPTPTGSLDDFSDIDAEAWYVDALKWAVGTGIMGGYDDGTMKPNASIPRQQIAVILYAYAGSPAVTDETVLDDFDDAGTVAGWAATAMKWAVENDFIGGSNNKLNPVANATRAMATQIVVNYYMEITE